MDLLEFVVPMARDGVAAEEPTLLLLRADTAQAVLHWVGPARYLTVELALEQPGQPAQHVATAGSMLPTTPGWSTRSRHPLARLGAAHRAASSAPIHCSRLAGVTLDVTGQNRSAAQASITYLSWRYALFASVSQV